MNVSKSKHVLGVLGSPRRDGNTEVLIDEILSGATEVGAKIIKVRLAEMDVRPCRGCFSCSKESKCIQDDDMSELIVKMKQSQVWVLGTPIYWWGPTAQFKAFLDRWVGIEHNHFRGKEVILVIPMGGGSESFARYTIGMLEEVLNYLNMKHTATILAPGFGDRGVVRFDKEIMAAAYNLGKNVAKQV